MSASTKQSTALEWQKVLVSKLESRPARGRKERRNGARRKGPLPPTVAQAARRMREVGSCLDCRVAKSAVSKTNDIAFSY